MTSQQSFNDFAAKLTEFLSLTPEQSVGLAELIDDRIKELGEEQISDGLDREFRRGQYDPDY